MFQFKLSGLKRAAYKHGLQAFYDDLESDPDAVPITDTLTTGASAVSATTTAYETKITTGGTAGAENINLPDGDFVGQRKLFTLAVRTNASDVVDLQAAKLGRLNISGSTSQNVTNLDLDAVGEYALLEWDGTEWNVIYTNGTIAAV